MSDPTQWSDRERGWIRDALNGTEVMRVRMSPVPSTDIGSGALDRDGDGFSDPSAAWGPELGGDVFPDDLTQWNDTDEDGFGDNDATT